MVNNQIEFNEEYNDKKRKEPIELPHTRNFQGELVIEDYSELEKLNLREVKNIDKVILKNLPKLENCTIWKCNTQELVIDNCSQIKNLNVRRNLLTDLEFIKDLEKLETLDLDGNLKIVSGLEYLPGNWENFPYENTKLTEVLKLYGNDWKSCKKDTQEIFELSTKKNFQGLIKKFWDLKKRHEDLKQDISGLLKEEKAKDSHRTTSEEVKIDKTREIFAKLEKGFKEKLEKINSLELQIRELTELSEKQRQKIQIYVESFSSEQELLKKLIIEYLGYIKFKKKELSSNDEFKKLRELEKCYQKLQDELENKLEKEEDKYKISRVLNDCEKWFEQELKIDKKLGNGKSLLVEGKEHLSKEPDSREKKELISKLEEKEVKIEEQSKTRQLVSQQNYYIFGVSGRLVFGGEHTSSVSYNQSITINYNKELAKQELTELEKNYQLIESVNELSSDPQKLKKTILFLATKQIFAITRQDTINSLIATYQNADKSGKKYETVDLVADYIGNAKEIASLVPGGGIVADILSKGIPAITNLLKSRSLTKHSQEFGNYLIEDEKALSLLEKTYQSLVASQESNSKKTSPILTSLLKFKPDQLNQHSAFGISKLSKEEELTVEKMTIAIDLLKNHFQDFVEELKQETGQYAEKMEKLFATEEGNDLQDELIELLEKLTGKESKNEQVISEPVSLEDQIQFKKVELEQLKNSVKGRLESRTSTIPIVGGIRNGKWHSRLEELLEKQEKIVRRENPLNEKLQKIKDQLKEKLAEKEIEDICQVQKDLTKLQMELENTQRKQAQQEVPV